MPTDTLTIPRLRGGGVVLGYSCSARCAHCLYGCGPHRRDGMLGEEGDLDGLLDLVARHASTAAFHIGGGEPFLHLDLLRDVIQGMAARRLKLDYVETNASWVKSREQTFATLEDLRGLGLEGLLVSVSPFHAAFVPPRKTMTLIEVAQRVLGRGVMVWIPPFVPLLREMDPDERLDLEHIRATHGDGAILAFAQRYGLVPGGRAGRLFATHGQMRPWQEVVRGHRCLPRLMDTTHFHVDLAGAYVPGLCAGLTVPLEEVPGEIDLGRYPILARLAEGNIEALVAMAMDEHEFVPLERGYSHACDLCTHVRLHMYHRERFPELGPAGFYDLRSIDGF